MFVGSIWGWGRTVRLQQARSSISTVHYSGPFDFLRWQCKQTYIWSKPLLLQITGPSCLRTQWNLPTLCPMRCYRRIGSVIFNVQEICPSAHHNLMCRTKTLLYVFLTFIRLMTYICRTAPLTSRCCILYIYSTNIHNEYFKLAAYSPIFSSSKCRLFHNATFFGSCIIHILNTGCAKI